MGVPQKCQMPHSVTTKTPTRVLTANSFVFAKMYTKVCLVMGGGSHVLGAAVLHNELETINRVTEFLTKRSETFPTLLGLCFGIPAKFPV